MLHLAEWQHYDVSEIRQYIEPDNDHRPEGQRQRNIASRVADFARGEGDVIPGIGGIERSDFERYTKQRT